MSIEKVNDKLDQAIKEVSENSALYINSPQAFKRDCKIDFKTVMRITLGLQGDTLSKELYSFFDNKNVISASAFTQQRSKISSAAFKALFKEFNSLCGDKKRFKGYRLFAVDGTSLPIAKDPENKLTYVKKWDRNKLLINAVYDICNKTFSDCLIQPIALLDERAAANSMIDNGSFPPRSILIADRGYESYNFLQHCIAKENLDIIVRVKNGIRGILNKDEFKDKEEFDEDINFLVARNALKESISLPSHTYRAIAHTFDFETPLLIELRAVRFYLKSGHMETIITSLPRDEFSVDDIKQLYHLRWDVETSFRTLKYDIGLLDLSSKKPDLVMQEIYSKLTMFNYAQRTIEKIVIEQDNNRKYSYKINNTMAIKICYDYFRNQKTPADELIRQYIIPIRPGRAHERNRNIKRRGANMNFSYKA